MRAENTEKGNNKQGGVSGDDNKEGEEKWADGNGNNDQEGNMGDTSTG